MTDTDENFFSDLISSELTQIKFSKYIVHFVFMEGCEISIESGFEHIGENGDILSRFDIYGPSECVSVHELLGAKVASVTPINEDLQIEFDRGGKIKIFRGKRMGEAYAVYLKGKHYIR